MPTDTQTDYKETQKTQQMRKNVFKETQNDYRDTKRRKLKTKRHKKRHHIG